MTPDKGSLKARWDELHLAKSDLLARSQQYAAWTLPHVFPNDTSLMPQSNHQLSNDSIGARGTNHLANRMVSTLFQPNKPFFRLALGTEQRMQLMAMSQDSKGADVGALTGMLDQQMSMVEQQCMEELNMIGFRPVGVLTAKLLIITGNALEFHPETGKSQVYDLRNYSVVRDVEGNVIEIMTRDSKAFATFSDEIQTQLRATKQYKSDADKDEVIIYTQIRLEDDGKFHIKQAADSVTLDIGYAAYPKKVLPWVPLTWNLARGDDYGTGLVQDYAGAFHSLELYTQSLIRISSVMGDLKFLVRPTSLLDVAALNNSPAGSYHSGEEGDVTAIQTNKMHDASFLLEMIERYTKQLAQAFMLNSSITRDAERVTAEEIRMQAMELETSHGGMYSLQASQWQSPLANILLDRIGFDGEEWGIEPQIITGMDTLSRQGEMENWFQWVQGMASLEAVPEDIRGIVNPLKWAAMWGRNLQVDYESVCYTDEELQEQAQAEAERMQQMQMMQAQAGVAQEAGKAAVHEGT